MALTYFQQNGSVGKGIKYNNRSYPNATIATSGCGVCSSLMVLHNMTTYAPTIQTLATLFMKGGARNGSGTDLTIGAKILANNYGLICEKTTDIDKLKAHLAKGYKAIAHVGIKGYFSSSGHFITIAGIDKNGRAIVLDPYYYANKWTSVVKGINRKTYFSYNSTLHEVYCNFTTIAADRKGYYYLFTPTKNISIKWSDNDKNKPAPAPAVVVNKPVEVTSSPTFTVGKVYTLTTNVKVRKGAGTNYGQLLRKNLTANAKANAKSGTYAVLKTGTRFTVKAIKTVNGNIWAKIPSGWICVYYNGKKYAK